MLRKESAGGMTEDVVMGFGDALGRTRLLRKETADGGSGFIELGKVLRLQGREALGMERVGSKLAEVASLTIGQTVWQPTAAARMRC
jgi:hypothetical protein